MQICEGKATEGIMISQNLLQRVSQLGKSWRGAFGETSKGSEVVCFAERETGGSP